MLGVFYRSDTRPPLQSEWDSDDEQWEIFIDGFDKRSPKKYKQPKLRLVAGKENAPDVVPDSAVCFTRDFQSAPLFPVGDLQTDSWVYVLEVDATKIFNTQGKQWDYVKDDLHGLSKKQATTKLWPMFGQERALNRVAAQQIVGAVKVKRKFNSNDVFNGGRFKCLKYISNPHFSGTKQVAKLATDMIGAFVSSGEYLPMPTCASGIVKSTMT